MTYRIWSIEHNAWWGPAHSGYSKSRAHAGVYDENEAKEICLRANIASYNMPQEAMVPIEDEPLLIGRNFKEANKEEQTK